MSVERGKIHNNAYLMAIGSAYYELGYFHRLGTEDMTLTNTDVHHKNVQDPIMFCLSNQTSKLDSETYFTAGAKADSATVLNPAARTAVACKKPKRTRIPVGISWTAGLPRSSTKKKNQSVTVRERTTVRRNQVW